MNPVRCMVTLALALLAPAALAQQPSSAEWDRLEIGARYWVSTGKTTRGHDASSEDCFTGIACGNPTSTLTYGGLDTNAVELYARKAFGESWFVKGLAGIGRVNTGTFTDQDFVLPGSQIMFLETVSNVSGEMRYGLVDIGLDVWKNGASAVGLFVGYQQWTEDLEGHGGSTTVDLLGLGSDLPPSVTVIRNRLTWQAARVGLAYREVNGRTRLNAEVAGVPYAKYRNEDSHLLRQSPSDLGPAPNVIANGRGIGALLELEVRRSFPELWDLDLGLAYRYWRLKSTQGDQTAAGFTFPITELESERQGVMFTITKRW